MGKHESLPVVESLGCGIQYLQILTRLETYGPSWLDVYLGACAGVAADARLPGLYGEYAESTQLDPFTACQGLLHALQDFFDCLFSAGARQASAIHYTLDEVLLDHSAVPSGAGGHFEWGALVPIVGTPLLYVNIVVDPLLPDYHWKQGVVR
jgi:hypothetical protein